jgi:hypothetical protein
MMAALGVGSRPWLARTASRNAVCIRCQVPVTRPGAEVAPYGRRGEESHAARPSTALLCGEDYKMALITSRISVVRG